MTQAARDIRDDATPIAQRHGAHACVHCLMGSHFKHQVIFYTLTLYLILPLKILPKLKPTLLTLSIFYQLLFCLLASVLCFLVHWVETTKTCYVCVCVCVYCTCVGRGAGWRTNTQANYPALPWVSKALHSGCLYSSNNHRVLCKSHCSMNAAPWREQTAKEGAGESEECGPGYTTWYTHAHLSLQEQMKHHTLSSQSAYLPACAASQLEQVKGVLMKTKSIWFFDGWRCLLRRREEVTCCSVLLLIDQIIAEDAEWARRSDKQISPIKTWAQMSKHLLYIRVEKNWWRPDTLFYEKLPH